MVVILSFAKDLHLHAQTPQIDSLKLALKNAKHDTTRCNILNAMIEAEDDDNVWTEYNKELMSIAETNLKHINNKHISYRSFKLHLSNSYNNIGFLLSEKGAMKEAINYYLKSLSIDEEFGNKSGCADVLNNIAYIYNNQGNVIQALKNHNKSLRIREEIGDKAGVAQSLIGIGVIYANQGDYQKAFENYNLSLQKFEELNDKNNIANALSCIAGIYINNGDLTNALEFSKKSLKVYEEIDNSSGIAHSLNILGIIYSKKKDMFLAKQSYDRSLRIRELIGDKRGIGETSNNIGFFYLSQNNFEKAIFYSSKSIIISKEIGQLENIRNSADVIRKSYKSLGNYRLALENYELYIQMRDSINNIETQKASIKQQTKYEYDKQKAVADEKHAFEIKQQEEKAAAEKKRQNIVIASVSVVLLLVALFSVILFNRFRITQKQKHIIEIKEKETQQQKHIIEEKHKEITDSINYAERIQRSFIATKEILNENLNDYFVLFKPKDVVSGDFYWASKLNNGNFALVTADSTGHGVPGAIMSLLNITSLEKAIETCTEPSEILNATRKTIIKRLKKDGSEHGGKDGMDASLTVYDFKNKKLIVAAANNPVWIIRNCHPERIEGSQSRDASLSLSMTEKEIIDIKPDKMPVGKHDKDTMSFTQQEIELQSGDVIYTLTDGFPDQFGGEKGKKFMSKNLRELLAANSHLPMPEQKQLLEKTFADWVGNLEQVDDVTLIGVRI